MLAEVAFTTIGLVFLLSAIRVFVSTLYQSYFGVLPNNTLGAIAIGLFAATILAPLVARIAGPRRAVVLSAAALAIGVVVATAWRNSLIDLLAAAAAVLGGLWWLALVHSFRREDSASPLVAALPLAIIADAAMRAAFHTVPLVEQPLPTAVPLVGAAALVFLAAGMASLPGVRSWTAPTLRGTLGLIAVPLLLVVGETSTTNAAQVAASGGLGLGPETAGSSETGALAIAVGLAVGTLWLARPLAHGRVAAVAIAVGAAILWEHVPWIGVAGGALLAAGTVAASAALVAAPVRPARSAIVGSAALALGWVGFVATAFVYHAFYLAEAIWVATALVVLISAVLPAERVRRLGTGISLVVVAVVLVASLSAALPDRQPDVAPLAPSSPFRLMTYNVHQGFDAFDVPAIDALVDTIARESPDVVVLEEVVRGWVIDDQHDVLGVLARRLGMRYVFQPNIGDLYGNAILSRMDLADVRRVPYAKEPNPRYQQRGALMVRVGDVLVVGTHLDEHGDASAVRQEQVRTLLRAVDGTTPVVIACDCNALPGTPELGLLADAGFVDLGAASGAGGDTFSADDPRERIDYVWGRGVSAAQGRVVDSTASDHRAIVVTISRTRP